MPRFFVSEITGGKAVIAGADALHLAKALRVRPGELITVCDPKGVDHICAVEQVSPEAVVAAVTQSRPACSEPPAAITLYQALCKGDKFETVVQKAVELGAGRIVPVVTGRCVSRPDPDSLRKKTERWQKIAVAAAKQSGRGVVPRVEQALDYPQAASQLAAHKLSILFYENATEPLGRALRDIPDDVGIMTGPEGGFETAEVELAAGLGVAVCSLGPRILRCETAPLAALSILTAVLEIL